MQMNGQVFISMSNTKACNQEAGKLIPFGNPRYIVEIHRGTDGKFNTSSLCECTNWITGKEKLIRAHLQYMMPAYVNIPWAKIREGKIAFIHDIEIPANLYKNESISIYGGCERQW